MQLYLFDTHVTMRLGQQFTRENAVMTGLSETLIAKTMSHRLNTLQISCILLLLLKAK